MISVEVRGNDMQFTVGKFFNESKNEDDQLWLWKAHTYDVRESGDLQLTFDNIRYYWQEAFAREYLDHLTVDDNKKTLLRMINVEHKNGTFRVVGTETYLAFNKEGCYFVEKPPIVLESNISSLHHCKKRVALSFFQQLNKKEGKIASTEKDVFRSVKKEPQSRYLEDSANSSHKLGITNRFSHG